MPAPKKQDILGLLEDIESKSQQGWKMFDQGCEDVELLALLAEIETFCAQGRLAVAEQRRLVAEKAKRMLRGLPVRAGQR